MPLVTKILAHESTIRHKNILLNRKLHKNKDLNLWPGSNNIRIAIRKTNNNNCGQFLSCEVFIFCEFIMCVGE